MTVSILQLMAFPFDRAAAARGGESPNRERRGPDNQGITRIHEGDRAPEQGRTADAGQPHARAADARRQEVKPQPKVLSLIHISEPTRRTPISYAVFCLKK